MSVVSRGALALGASLLVLSSAHTVHAETVGAATLEPAASRLRFAGGLGFGLAAGNARPGLAMSELIPPPLVFAFDGAWAPVPSFDFGLSLFARLGLGTPHQCPAGGSCSLASSGDLLLRARYHLRPSAALDPWFGLGAGLEVLDSHSEHTVSNSDVFGSSHTVKQSDLYYGPVLALPELGLDYRPKRSLAWGVLVAASIARYTALKSTTESGGDPEGSSTARIRSSSLHTWLMVVGQVTFDVGL